MNLNREHETQQDSEMLGEWGGLRPCKWRGNKKIIKLIDNNPFDRK